MTSSLDIEALRRIGLTQALLPALLALPHGRDTAAMRAVEIQRDRALLHDGRDTHLARLPPALLQAWAEDEDALAVGDWVLAARNAYGEWSVAERAPAVNRIVRRDNHSGRRQPLVANVDTALLVMGLDADYNLRRLERYLALARLSQVAALVVLTKADGCVDTGERLAQVQAHLPPHESVVAVDGRAEATRERLAPWLGLGRTLVVLGSSGAGKSTLTNTLAEAASQATGGTRSGDGRGRHTTTVRSLHLCASGACIIDTPGLRTLRLEADQAGLEAVFEDIGRLALYCRFRDCHHVDEPGCEVRAQVPAARLANYHKLLREARRDTVSALERRDRVSQLKARSRAVREHMKAKRGEATRR